MTVSRRNFIALGTGLVLTGCSQSNINPKRPPHVVIIGGGFGGATVAKYIRKLDTRIKITLIEPNALYSTCPASNWVLAGIKSPDSIRFNYHALSKQYAITVIQDYVTEINSTNHTVHLSTTTQIRYDRLVVSPGIDFRWDSIAGYTPETANIIPHAWKADSQTRLLNTQLQQMRNGGTVIICAPPNPYRCPPGPYERASMMAYYLKQTKPKSKIIILDQKASFSKQALFESAWERYYQYNTRHSLIEWHAIPDNPVISVDINNKTVETDFGDKFTADVLNIIPAQKAGYIAEKSGLTDITGWCPVHHQSSESILQAGIHVIGDASIHTPLPKSAFAANSEAKICAFAIVNLLNGRELIEPSWVNTCYSLITPNHGISIAMVYKLNQHNQIFKVKGAGGSTPLTGNRTRFSLESKYAKDWYRNITTDTFG